MRPSPSPVVRPTQTTESVIQYVTAYAYLDRGDYSQAERYFETVTQMEPQFARGWDGLGQAHLYQSEYDEALIIFDKAIALKPTLAQAYSNRSYARIATGDVEGSMRDAEKALSLNDKMVDPQIVIGRILSSRGDYAGALERFDRAVQLSPEQGGSYLWRGRFYRDVIGDYGRALADMDRAVERSPAIAQMYLDRAITGLYAEAPVSRIKEDLEEALSLAEEPRLPDIIDRVMTLQEAIAEAERTGGRIAIPPGF